MRSIEVPVVVSIEVTVVVSIEVSVVVSVVVSVCSFDILPCPNTGILTFLTFSKKHDFQRSRVVSLVVSLVVSSVVSVLHTFR